MNKRPTEAEILKEAAILREMKPRVRHYSTFGDNHWDSIETQIVVLEERLTDDEIADRFSGRQYDAAMDVRFWMDGEGELQSAEWEALATPDHSRAPESSQADTVSPPGRKSKSSSKKGKD